MSQYHHYEGLLKDIPESQSSAGVRFLKAYLPILDQPAPLLRDACSPSATFSSNGGEPMPVENVVKMFARRPEMLSYFSHTDFPIEIWDMEAEAGKRTVIFKSVSR